MAKHNYLIKYNKISGEPYIFYNHTKHQNYSTGAHTFYYQNVAYNSGYLIFKKPKFKTFSVKTNGNFDIDDIDMSLNATSLSNLIKINELIRIINNKRSNNDDPEFCKTIYDAIIQIKEENDKIEQDKEQGEYH